MADKMAMVPAESWRDHFKIDDTIVTKFWEEFSENSPLRASELSPKTADSSVEFILWCIREGHFSEESFIYFQSLRYNLPVIRQEFFETPVDLHFWDRMKDLHPWNAQCLPISDWDGILLIASIWPEQTFKSSIHHRLVLATPSLLRGYFERFQTTKKPAAPTASDDGDPFAALSRSLGLAETQDSDAAENESGSNDQSSEAPEGLVLPDGLSFSSDDLARLNQPEGLASPAPADLDATQPSIVMKQAPEIVTPPAPKKSPPPMMPFAPEVTPDKPAMVKPLVIEAPIAPPPPAPPQAPPAPPAAPLVEETIVAKIDKQLDEKPSNEEASPATKVRRPLFEPTSNPNPPAPPNEPSTHTQAGTGTGTGTRSRRLEVTPVTSLMGFGSGAGPTTNPVNAKSAVRSAKASESYSGRVVSIGKLEPIHLDQCTTIDEAGAQAMLQVCNIFENAMILLFKDGVLQPWKWTDLFLSVKGDKPDAIDLTEPSIFKVVFRTAKPYHGYVVTSGVNQKFMNEFNRGMLPKHATVIPVMIDGRMGGMLLGFTNSKIEYRQSLRLMERLAFDLARIFKTLRGTMAKSKAS